MADDGFFKDWQVEGYGQYGTADNRGYQQGIRLDRIVAAVDAVPDPANPGRVVCRAALMNAAKWGDCVPINLFGDGNASDEAIDYVTQFTPGQQITTPLYFTRDGYATGRTITYTSSLGKVYNTTTKQTLAELSASGKVFEGWGAGPIAAAFGLDYRKEEIEQIVYDPSNPASDPAFFPARDPAVRGIPSNINTRTSAIQNSTVPNIYGSYQVKEAFTEVQVPLLADKLLAKQLNFLGAARYADYQGSGGIWAWKYGLDWQLIDSLRLRGTMSRDIRAATLAERFDFTGGIGTVARGPAIPHRRATDRHHPHRRQPDPRSGGSRHPHLRPGLSPGWLQGFSASLDYWEIDIAGAIGVLGLQRIVDDCNAGSAAACRLVTRDPATNRLVQVVNVSQNINAAGGRGVDLELGYQLPINLFRDGGETVGFRLFYSHLLENSTTNLGAPKVDVAGQTGYGQNGYTPLPEHSVTANLSYDSGSFNAFLQARYLSSGERNATHVEGVNIDDNSVDSATYVDLRLGYSWELGEGTLDVYLSALNLLDKSPPVAAYFDSLSASAYQSNAALFDPLGRRFTVGAQVRF